MTSSPGPIPRDAIAVWSAAVPLATLIAWAEPFHLAHSFSKLLADLTGPIIHLAAPEDIRSFLDGALLERRPCRKLAVENFLTSINRQLCHKHCLPY